MTEKQYGRLVKEMSPKSPVGRDCFNAFWIGGVICVLGQLLINGYGALGLEKEQAFQGPEHRICHSRLRLGRPCRAQSRIRREALRRRHRCRLPGRHIYGLYMAVCGPFRRRQIPQPQRNVKIIYI